MFSPKENKISLNIKSNHYYSYLMYLNLRRKSAIEYYRSLKELRVMMKNDTLNTFLQPILNLQSGDTIGFEVFNRPSNNKVFNNTEMFYDFVGQSNQVFLFECYCRNISLKRFMERQKENIKQKNPLIFINIHPNVLLDSNYQSGETLQLLSELGIE